MSDPAIVNVPAVKPSEHLHKDGWEQVKAPL